MAAQLRLTRACGPVALRLAADADTTVVIPALALLYLFAVGRYGASRGRIICFAGAILALLAVAFWTPLHHLGLHYLLTAHLLQNVLLAEWAPSSRCSESQPRWLRPRALPQLAAPRPPAVALPVWLVNYYPWHVPAIYDAALHRQHWLIHVEHACYFGTGILVWWPLVHDLPRALASAMRPRTHSRPSSSPRRSACCWHCCHGRSTRSTFTRIRASGLSPLGDQQVAGVTMASEQAIVLFVVFAYWFRRFLETEGAI